MVTPRTSAIIELNSALAVYNARHFKFTPNGADKAASPLLIETALFGRPPTDILRGAILTNINDNLLLNVIALGFAMARYLDIDEIRDFYIW